jgi:hypothetical protein
MQGVLDSGADRLTWIVGSRWAFVPVQGPWLRSIEPTPIERRQGQTTMKRDTKSLEECLQEAAECERLADLARLESVRRVLALSASYWRELAVKAAQRDRTYLH